MTTDPGPVDTGPGPGDPSLAGARLRAGRLLDGFLTTQLLYVAAKLGVADVLATGPRTGRRSPRRSGPTPIC
jgi:hypothetical protein